MLLDQLVDPQFDLNVQLQDPFIQEMAHQGGQDQAQLQLSI